MKFVIDESGVLIPAKEETLAPIVIRRTKPLVKTVVFISLSIGAIWLFLHFFPLVSLPIQDAIVSFVSTSSIRETFTNFAHAKGV